MNTRPSTGSGNLTAIAVAGVVLLALGAGLWVFHPHRHALRFPEVLVVADFQRGLDRDLTAPLNRILQTRPAQALESKLLKPALDDVTLAHLNVAGVEVRPGQFPGRPELLRIVQDCARMLHIPTPRVFVVNDPARNAHTMNFKEPVIVVNSGLLNAHRDPAELRFILGHEMGHIKCGHVKWQMALRGVLETFRVSDAIPEEAGVAPFLPLFWEAREAEMSADNAGLICCQDLTVAEETLVRLVTGASDADLGKVDVKAYLDQSGQQTISKFAEVVQYGRQLLQDHPFVPDRILQLREHAKSVRYQHLWQ
ncbi:MAG TPA: M48 family metallopeptidase [Verrucomicrobiota bacterium]|nr:M48 family metallopeptidase [Verrucomicrobiota bacterium]